MRGAVRRRRWVAAVAALGVAVTACGGDAPAGAVATAGCAEVEFPPLVGGSHLLGDQEPPVPYTSVPGTSGWHAAPSTQPAAGVRSEPLPEPELVLLLEVGQVVVAYDPEEVRAAEVERLAALAEGALDNQMTVTPFPADMGAAVVLNAWGVRQPCRAVDEQAITRFVTAYADRAPGRD